MVDDHARRRRLQLSGSHGRTGSHGASISRNLDGYDNAGAEFRLDVSVSSMPDGISETNNEGDTSSGTGSLSTFDDISNDDMVNVGMITLNLLASSVIYPCRKNDTFKLYFEGVHVGMMIPLPLYTLFNLHIYAFFSMILTAHASR